MATVKKSTSSATTISNSHLFSLIIFFLFPAIIFSIRFYFFSSSSSSQQFINRGSSISSSSTSSNSSSTTSFWLSPSGLFAFGFYPLNSSCDHQEEFIIGIWLVKSSQRTLVWSINRNELPYSTFTNATSLLLKNDDGKFVIQTSTSGCRGMMIIKETPLFFDISPVTYALLHDNGNLVFYDWDDNIIWESFDYPTDTILPGQTLNPGKSLVTRHSTSDISNNRLTMTEDGNLVLFKEKRHEGNVPYEYIDWESHTKKKTSPIELRLNSTGHLYLVDWNGYIMKRLDNYTKQQNDEGMIAAAGAVLYRATLDSDGVFRLYKEIIRSSLGGCECECEKTENSTIILWGTNWSSSTTKSDTKAYVTHMVYAVMIFGGLGIITVIADCVDRLKSKLSYILD